MGLYQPLAVEVKSVGEDVVLAIGSFDRIMHFETAVLLATWMDECARDAKVWASDTQRRLKGVGTLHDAADHRWLQRGQPFTRNKVYPVSRDLLKASQISVRPDGGVVVLTIGAAEASIPYKAALQISQWIRLKAKESQARAGDMTRHWSKIVQTHAVQHGG